MNNIETNDWLQIKAGTWPKLVADKEGVASIAALQTKIEAMKVEGSSR
jgi:hypothetical protein